MTSGSPPDEVPEIEILSSQAESFEAPAASTGTPAETTGPSGAAAGPPAGPDDWKAKHDEVKDRLMWVAADFENYKKRMAKEREEQHKYSQSSLLKEILPVLDNLERAMAALKGHEQEATPAFAALKQGVDMVLKQFHSVLERHGVVRIEAVGKPFDPRFHEVMMQVDSAELPEDTVLDELQGGYMIQDRVLRPARVRVTRKPSA
jgi:molecular chaperone GrpE